MAEMNQWEYQALSMGSFWNTIKSEDLEAALNELGEEGWEVDEDFLAALEHGMPGGSGIALGFDRLAMLASGARDIAQVLWLPRAV